jgi:hypothetical protein
MKKHIFTAMVAMTLAGCASTTSTTTKNTLITLPSLNEIHEAYLGDPIITQAWGSHTPSVTVGTADGVSTAIYGGKFYFDGKYFVSKNPKAIGSKNGFGSVVAYSNIAAYNPKEHEFCPTPSNWSPCYNSNELDIVYNPDDFRLAPASFKQEIEYNGKQVNILNFTYREFSENSARAAYTTDFKIDLDESDTFGYKGAQFKVIKGTNNKFTYQIIKGFRSSDNDFN